jgi:hypothetical protein
MTSNKQADDAGAVAAIASDVFDLKEPQTSASTFLRILRSPIRRIMELTKDPSFTGHGKFFRTATYLYILAAGFASARNYSSDFMKLTTEQGEGTISAMNRFSSAYASALTPIVTYLSFVAYFIFGYMIFSRLGTSAKTKRDYLKLRCLSGGFTALLAVPITLLSVFYMSEMGDLASLAQKAGPLSSSDFNMQSVWFVAGVSILLYAYLIYIPVFEVRLQKRYWGIGTWRAIAGALVTLVIVWGCLFAVQFAAMKITAALT